MQQRRMSDQPDLFQKHRPHQPVWVPDQTVLIQLLGALLLETLPGRAPVKTGKEGDDEQDHA